MTKRSLLLESDFCCYPATSTREQLKVDPVWRIRFAIRWWRQWYSSCWINDRLITSFSRRFFHICGWVIDLHIYKMTSMLFRCLRKLGQVLPLSILNVEPTRCEFVFNTNLEKHWHVTEYIMFLNFVGSKQDVLLFSWAEKSAHLILNDLAVICELLKMALHQFCLVGLSRCKLFVFPIILLAVKFVVYCVLCLLILTRGLDLAT